MVPDTADKPDPFQIRDGIKQIWFFTLLSNGLVFGIAYYAALFLMMNYNAWVIVIDLDC